MKTLTLLRHAKSGWDDPIARDFDRPLNPKGRRAAEAIGREMKRLGLTFDHVVASPAVRVEETIAGVEAGYGSALAPAWDRRLYLASAGTLLDLAREAPAEAATLLLIGHNPGLEELVLDLAAAGALREEVEEKYPTGTLAELTFAVETWGELAPNGGDLTRFVRPRDLDAALGPGED